MTTPPEPKGVVVILGTTSNPTDGTYVAQTVVFPRGFDWEYNDRRLTVLDIDRKKLGEFREGCYLGVGFKDEVRVNRLREPAPAN